ncbi:hypothetical protein [Kitasatospora sp. NPDC092286]|uniref:hypothetical protein n=1 Tax=Kitasatospora sp. NPDC092286 TaxID=3364087 RepID=UPI00382E4D5B
MPVLATTLDLLAEPGPLGPVWWRYGRQGRHSLTDALDNPDGDRLLEAEQTAHAQARGKEWRQAERERRRPACTRCRAKFSDERWAEHERADTWGDDGLCADCRRADADQRAREAAEHHQAAAEAAAAGAWWRRS